MYAQREVRRFPFQNKSGLPFFVAKYSFSQTRFRLMKAVAKENHL